MTKPINLSARRASEKQDCRLITPLDTLKELVEDIENGDIAPAVIFVAMKVPDKEDKNYVNYNYRCAGGTNMELSGLLAQHLHRLCMPGDLHND